jgi:hypothetical protein
MTGASFGKRIWYGSPVPVFIEKVLIPVGAVAFSYLMWTNPMNFDWIQRASLGSAVLLFLFFLSYSLHLRSETIRTGTAPSQKSPPATHVSGDAKTEGDKSPANTGDGNTFNYSDSKKN